ncbi:hypothetical protein GCM10023204_37880 [Actinomycetospora succinea]
MTADRAVRPARRHRGNLTDLRRPVRLLSLTERSREGHGSPTGVRLIPEATTDPDGVARPFRDRKAARDTATLPQGP